MRTGTWPHVQLPWSLWWLRTHERGPMEALWARLTYGRRPPAATAPATATPLTR